MGLDDWQLVAWRDKGGHVDSDGLPRKLTAVLYADVAGYSRLTGEDEEGTHRLLSAYLDQFTRAISEHSGRVVHYAGDAVLADFGTVTDALRCAISVQSLLDTENAALPPDRRVEFRIGVNLGEVIVDRDDIYGDGVNVAARLEGLAEPGGIVISETARTAASRALGLHYEFLGERQVKNIAEPIRAYRVHRKGERPSQGPAQPSLPNKPSIAVLPFDNMSKDPDQEYFADGLTESITATLSRIGSFFVIARNSAFTYKGKAVGIETIGRELGVSYVLEGSVQRGGERLRVTTQLIETERGSHIWSERFDGNIGDVFELQDNISESVAGALQPSIRVSEIERSRRKRPNDLNAYDLTMRAMPHVWALDEKDSGTALDFLSKALDIDPDYPLALSLTAWCHGQRAVYNWSDDIARSQADAVRLAEKAAHLNDEDSLALAVLGAVHSIVRNFGRARVILERAVSVDPNCAWAWSRLGWLENYSDNPGEAIHDFQKALRLSPRDPMNFNNYAGMGSAFDLKLEHSAALEMYERALQEHPNARWIDRQLAACLFRLGRVDEAKDVYARLISHYPNLTAAKVRQAMVMPPSYMDRLINDLTRLGLAD